MKNLFLRLANNHFALYNVIIAGIYTLASIFLLIAILANNAPSELQTATGTVSRIRQYDADNGIVDTLLNNHSYFNVTFTNGMFFETTGDLYDKIDKTLFYELSVGDELTVTYLPRGYGANNIIYGLEYNGVTYLDKNEAPSPPNQYKKMITYIIIWAAVTGLSIGLVILNYFVTKRKSKTKKCP